MMKISTSGKEPSRDEIALRAFLIWEKDGRQPGREMSYWLQAESEIRSSNQKKAVVAAAKAAKPWPPQAASIRSQEVKIAEVAQPAPKAAAKALAKTTTKAAPVSKPVPTARLATPAKPVPPSKPAATRANFTASTKAAARPTRRTT